MRHFGYNLTYSGFIILENSSGNTITERMAVQCSEIVRKFEQSHEGVRKIIFFFPDDWLDTQFRNKKFIEYWTTKVSGWLWPVSYVGADSPIGKSEIGSGRKITLREINSRLGYNMSGDPSPEADKGDFIRNDSWHRFEMNVDVSAPGCKWMMYVSYCMIRYVFCSSLNSIVKDFLYCLSWFKSNYGTSGIIDEFKIMQMVHYYPDRQNIFYNSTYSLFPVGNVDSLCNTLLSIDDVKNKFSAFIPGNQNATSVNNVFMSGPVKSFNRRRIIELLNQSKIKGAYDELI